MKNLALHWKILIGMALGVVFGILATMVSWGPDFVKNWIKPFGTIFISLLKLIAIPLIIASLIKGISDLQDIAKFRKIGGRTIITYIITTLMAIAIGLLLVNMVNPGSNVSAETIAKLTDGYSSNAADYIDKASKAKEAGPLQFIEDMVPQNIFEAMANNRNMLQVIFFVIFFGICLLLIKPEQSKPIRDFIGSLNEVIMKMVDLIMLYAPFAVFALIAGLIAGTADPDIFVALGYYALTLVAGLFILILLYGAIVKVMTGMGPRTFYNGISPAQLVAFSTSSSAATLPVTMERVEEHLGVDSEVTSFVCPVGATVNMDGTSLYQAVAAVFICQALGHDLSIADQFTIVITATLASIGSAAVPSAGIVMLVMVLESVGLPADKLAVGIAMIFAVDRPLDMCRTVVNVTGDAMVALLVGKSVGAISPPKPKQWDDNYQT